jgi:hypothetical protein
MSQEVIDALSSGEIDPLSYWVRHESSWRNIQLATHDINVMYMYNELADVARDVAEVLAFDNALPNSAAATAAAAAA